jgi:dienelactone hydrolase
VKHVINKVTALTTQKGLPARVKQTLDDVCRKVNELVDAHNTLPVLDNEAAPTAYDQIVGLASPRISAGLVYLQQQGFKGSYIVAHSMGSRMASHFLADTEMSVSGFVGIGMNIGTVEYLNKFSLPMLDIYGSNDLEGVLSSAPDRARQSASNAHYTQLIVDGADHFFNGMDDELVDEVVKWINSH